MTDFFAYVIVGLIVAFFVIPVLAVLMFGLIGASTVLASIGAALHRLFRF